MMHLVYHPVLPSIICMQTVHNLLWYFKYTGVFIDVGFKAGFDALGDGFKRERNSVLVTDFDFLILYIFVTKCC